MAGRHGDTEATHQAPPHSMRIPAELSRPGAKNDRSVSVSVIVPAFNAAETIADTLQSVCAQTWPAWEAIVVDDGSSDGTAAIAQGFADREARVRIVTQMNCGEGAARNAGIAHARYDWLLFLDADDWISPRHLERLTATLRSRRNPAAVYCGSARVALDGTEVIDPYVPPTGDLFPTLTRNGAFPVHACIVRRSIVEDVGGFDPSLKTCADWDLWQRIARTGARFGAVREVLAYYRMRPNSASQNATQLLTDGLRIIRQGHAPDARVAHPHRAHARGSSPDQMAGPQFYLIAWCAGLMIGAGQSAIPLLLLIHDVHCRRLHPKGIAQCLFGAAIHATCRTAGAWDALWPAAEPLVDEFLPALERQSQTPALAARARVEMKKMILAASPTWGPLYKDAQELDAHPWVRLGRGLGLLRRSARHPREFQE